MTCLHFGATACSQEIAVTWV